MVMTLARQRRWQGMLLRRRSQGDEEQPLLTEQPARSTIFHCQANSSRLSSSSTIDADQMRARHRSVQILHCPCQILDRFSVRPVQFIIPLIHPWGFAFGLSCVGCLIYHDRLKVSSRFLKQGVHALQELEELKFSQPNCHRCSVLEQVGRVLCTAAQRQDIQLPLRASGILGQSAFMEGILKSPRQSTFRGDSSSEKITGPPATLKI